MASMSTKLSQQPFSKRFEHLVGVIGGSLDRFAERPLIAGRLPNQPGTLVQWLRDAPSLSPETGMPPMPITDADARDVAAYLYTLQ